MLILKYKIPLKEYQTESNSFLEGFKKLNIFIGANNSGKSRLLRSIFQSRVDDCVFFSNYSKQLTQISVDLTPQFNNQFAMADLNGLCTIETGSYATAYNAFIFKVNNTLQRSNGAGNIWDADVAAGIRNKIQEYNLPQSIEDKDISYNYIYIPIIRGIRSIYEGDLYRDKTVSDYGFSSDASKEVFTGQSIYEEIKKMLLGSKKDRKIITDFEQFLSDYFFEGRGVTLVADYGGKNVKIDIGDGEDFRELHNVGDGIQSIILCCFPAFKTRDKETVLLIEEPELTMHPSVQRVLVEVLLKYFPKLQIFITTHSNHFIDLVYDHTDEISVYTFEREASKDNFYIRNVSNYSKIIDLIGLRNSSVFLANSVIWTEGVTDRMFLRKLLQMKSGFDYKEDYHYTFAEYGGSNLENFDFATEEELTTNKVSVKAISKRNFILVDNDLNAVGSSKDLRIKKLKIILGTPNIYDKYIEIENLIPFAIWVKTIEKIITNSTKIGYKFKANYIQQEVAFNSQLKTRKIGDLLKEYIVELKQKTKTPKYFASDSILCLAKDKKTIMQYVIKVIEDESLSFDDMGIDASDVVASIERFIKKANQKNATTN